MHITLGYVCEPKTWPLNSQIGLLAPHCLQCKKYDTTHAIWTGLLKRFLGIQNRLVKWIAFLVQATRTRKSTRVKPTKSSRLVNALIHTEEFIHKPLKKAPRRHTMVPLLQVLEP
mmetsp:Transcript_3219/g.4640  ORF Transcript_3219/g.4640 Transcript_3219/m.4640 type:complete len:115 (+) Transcript_3219:520-864(+)